MHLVIDKMIQFKHVLVTNGYWAESAHSAKKTLTPLVDAGLNVLNLSVDDFHTEYIKFYNINNAYWAAVELDTKIVLMVSTGKNSTLNSETIPKLLEDKKIQISGKPKIINPNAVIFETQFTPIGRGTNLEYTPHHIQHLTCSDVLRDIGIKPNGAVLPCCGPLGSLTTIGNINQQPLETILTKAKNNPKIIKIKQGPNIKGQHASKCHACLENISAITSHNT